MREQSALARDYMTQLAAKGPALLGVRFVLAESYERIHRSNLVGMGIVPLQFAAGDSAASLGLDGTETFAVRGFDGDIVPGQRVTVEAIGADGADYAGPIGAKISALIGTDNSAPNGAENHCRSAPNIGAEYAGPIREVRRRMFDDDRR